ncbi:MAG: hypothetical protein IT435_10615 [Phycisphaerales bacterium]|nr:hypothetical protein [Phycisphaerales bacterium]
MNAQSTTKSMAPCGGQTPEEFLSWHEEFGLVVGDEVAVRTTHGGFWRYEIDRVAVVNHGRQRRIVLEKNGSFYRNGKNCFHPKGQTRLVWLTDSVRGSVLLDEVFVCIDRP